MTAVGNPRAQAMPEREANNQEYKTK